MRILLANKFLHPRGGAERAVLGLGMALARRGHEVSWFGMQHADNAVAGAGVAVVRARDYHAAGARRFRDAAAMLYSFAARRQFEALLRRARPQVVHLHNIYHQLTPSIIDAARAHCVPVLMTAHDYKLVCPRYDLLRRGLPCDACIHEGVLTCVRFRCGGSWAASAWLAAEALLHQLRDSYGGVRLFLAPSRFMAAMLAHGGIEPARLRYLPNFAAAEAPGSVSQAPERFVYGGRLSAEKGVRTLLRAAARLRRGTLVVCGSGPLEAEVRVLAASAPAGRVELRGHVSTTVLWQEMQRASFTVLPSEWFENAPFAVLESMALGRAVLASPMGGVPELVVPGETGDLVAAGDVEAWREALESALAAPTRMYGLGEGARRFTQERLSLATHLEAMERVYEEVRA